MVDRVGVVGLGLIGGSIARGVLAGGGTVKAWTRSAATRSAAAEIGVDVVGSLAEVVEGAGVVVLATPLPVLPDTLDEVAAALRGVAEPPTVTDVGSVKVPLVAHASAVLADRSVFVPGHPLAGTEHRGWDASEPGLFEGTTWALCDDAWVDRDRWDQVARLAESLGAAPVAVAAATHDITLALTSHVPYALAAVLSDQVAAASNPDWCRRLSGGSLQSATRVVRGGGASLGAEMLWANRTSVVGQLEGVTLRLDALRRVLESDDREPVDELFARASALWADGGGEPT